MRGRRLRPEARRRGWSFDLREGRRQECLRHGAETFGFISLCPLVAGPALVGDVVVMPVSTGHDHHEFRLELDGAERLGAFTVPWWSQTYPRWATFGDGFMQVVMAGWAARHAEQVRRCGRQEDGFGPARTADAGYAEGSRISRGELDDYSENQTYLYMDLHADLGNVGEARRHAKLYETQFAADTRDTEAGRLWRERISAELADCRDYLNTLEL